MASARPLTRAELHTCHARACEAHVPPRMLMCRKHWFTVPKRIQARVWATYREGQCDDMRPSREWHQAADAAIGYVAIVNSQPVRLVEVEALNALGYEVTGEARRLHVRYTGRVRSSEELVGAIAGDVKQGKLFE